MLSGGRQRCRWMWLAPFFLFASVATASGQQRGRGAAPCDFSQGRGLRARSGVRRFASCFRRPCAGSHACRDGAL